MKWLPVPLAVILLAGCSPAPVTTAPPLTADELRVARQALSVEDVSLMLRGGYTHNAIIAEVQRRRVAQAPDAATELNMVQFGATPTLIAALKAKENLLNEQQKEAFDAFKAEKVQRVAEENRSQQLSLQERQLQAEQDRQRRQQLAYQTVRNANVTEATENARRRAWDTHKAQKESIERQIQQVQTSINRKRSSGYRENELLHEVQLLERLNEQLRNLPTPQLP